MQKEIEKLRELQKRILYTRNCKEKYFLLRDYYHLYYFLLALNKKPPKDILILPSYENAFDIRCAKDQEKSIVIIENNMQRLESICKELIALYHQNNFFSYTNTKYSGVNYQKMSSIMSNFFWELGDDVLALYHQMIREGRIKNYPIKNMDGGCFSTMYTDLAYIVLGTKDDNLNMYVDLSHEMGHVYEWFLEKNKMLYINDVNVFSEIISNTFEKLFMLYLEKNNLFKDIILKREQDYHSSQLNRIAVCKLICDLKKEGNLEYLVGEDYELNSKLSKEEIKRRLEPLCGMVYDRSLEISLLHFIYLIGDVISSYFYYRIQEDYEKGIEELKSFVLIDKIAEPEIVFDKYLSDLSYHKKYIKEFMDKRRK